MFLEESCRAIESNYPELDYDLSDEVSNGALNILIRFSFSTSTSSKNRQKKLLWTSPKKLWSACLLTEGWISHNMDISE